MLLRAYAFLRVFIGAYVFVLMLLCLCFFGACLCFCRFGPLGQKEVIQLVIALSLGSRMSGEELEQSNFGLSPMFTVHPRSPAIATISRDPNYGCCNRYKYCRNQCIVVVVVVVVVVVLVLALASASATSVCASASTNTCTISNTSTCTGISVDC